MIGTQPKPAMHMFGSVYNLKSVSKLWGIPPKTRDRGPIKAGDAENAEHENARHENVAPNDAKWQGWKMRDIKIRERGTMEHQHNLHSKRYCNCKMHCNVDEKRY